MALPDSFKITTGTAIILADTTDHSPAAKNNLGARTDQIDLTSLGAGAARQSAKFDFGEFWDQFWAIKPAIEAATAFADGELIEFYLGTSHSATVGTGNPGNLTGVDGAYTGYAAGLTATLPDLFPVGSLRMTTDATTVVQIAQIGLFAPRERYGMLVAVNKSSADALVADAVEMSVALYPQHGQLRD